MTNKISRRGFGRTSAGSVAMLAIAGAMAPPALGGLPSDLDPVSGLRPSTFRFPFWGESEKLRFDRVIATVPVEYLDHRGEVQLLSGIDLTRFKKNPVICGQCGNISAPIGMTEYIRPVGDSLELCMQIRKETADRMRSGAVRYINTGWIVREQSAPTWEERQRFGRGLKMVTRKWELVLVHPLDLAFREPS